MPPNYVHKIVHISTLFYQSLSIISASGRKLFKMKNSKSFFLHLVHVRKTCPRKLNEHGPFICKDGIIGYNPTTL